MILRIANAAGFLGDDVDAPRRLVEATEVDYLTLEYLAELTMSILARLRQRDPQAGFARDFLDVVASLTPALERQPRLRVVTNAGGVNPDCCARQAALRLCTAGLGAARLGVVTGDDLLPRLDELRGAGCDFVNLDDGRPLTELTEPVISANAYLGAAPIAEALASDARLVVTGRVADASLTVGPAMHAFGWQWDDWDRLAAATVAGHLIECGAQVTGGYSNRWRALDLSDVGYPVAEIDDAGQVTITKPAGTGGVVDRQSVVEQLVYEIGDPRRYLTPDVVADFAAVAVSDQGGDRVQVTEAEGTPAPEHYKVSLAYQAGYMASSQLLVGGPDCVAKARACRDIVANRLRRAGMALDEMAVELLGAGGGWPVPAAPRAAGLDNAPREVVLRIAVRDRRREHVERFTKEIAPLVTSGPAGLAGYAAGRSAVRPVFAYWPALVPRALVSPRVEVRSASSWAE